MKYREFIKVFNLNDGVPKSKHLTRSQIAVYGYIHSWWENHKSACTVSYEEIAARVDIARSTVALSIVKLEALGWIHVVHGARVSENKNECNTYQVLRMPDPTIKHTKKIICHNDVLIKTEKTEEQKITAKKYAMLKMAKGTFSYDEYQELKAFLKI